MKDMLGNELVNGDFVAYGSRFGNSGELRLGIITNVKKASILTGGAYHRTYDWKTKTNVDFYEFTCSGVQGHGVSGDKLMKLNPDSYSQVFEILMEKADKYL